MLSLGDLEDGDVLLLHDTSETTHKAIAAAQAVFSHSRKADSGITHAGVFHDGHILEASGGAQKVQSVPLAAKKAGYHYEVYRYRPGRGLPAAAATYGAMIAAAAAGGTFGTYSVGSRGGGIFASSKRGRGAESAAAQLDAIMDMSPAQLAGSTRPYYCSNFVVECYEAACRALAVAPVIDLDFRFVSPKKLQGCLRKNGAIWDAPGVYVATGVVGGGVPAAAPAADDAADEAITSSSSSSSGP